MPCFCDKRKLVTKYFGSLVVVNSNRLIQTSNLVFGRFENQTPLMI